MRRDFVEVAICEVLGARVKTTPEALELLGASLEPTDRVAMEVSGGSWEVARILEPHVRTVHRISEPVTAHRCLKRADQLSCRKGERPGTFGSKRFSARPGDRIRIRISLDRRDVRNKLRQPRGNPNERDVFLLIRFRDRDGLEGARWTRLLLKLKR